MDQAVKKTNSKDRRNRINSQAPNHGLGKLPPQATDLEEAVLGAMMLEKTGLLSAINLLKPEHFYKDNHQKIFNAIHILFDRSSPIDILTVTAQLRLQGDLEMIGGAYYITELTNRVASASNIEYHSRIIIQKFIQRELIRISSEVINIAYEDTTDVLELQSFLNLQLTNIYNANEGKAFVNASDLLAGCLNELQDNNDGIHLTGIASGLEGLDEITGGWQNSDLIIVAARPGMGKTAFMLHAAREAAIYQAQPIGIFSLEMNSKQVVQRLIAAEANISMNDIKFRYLKQDRFKKAYDDVSGIANATILIDDTAAISITDLRAKAIKMKYESNVKMLFIDYLGLMRPSGVNKYSNRTNDVGEISRALKSLAKELDIPVIVLSQLNRAVEDRKEQMPMLRDLRDSGDIEQDADMVLFLYRPEYYGITEDANGPTENKCYIAIAKHRNGSLGIPGVYFDPEYMKFDNENSSKPPF